MNILHAGIFRDHQLGGDIIFEKGLLQNRCRVERFDYRFLASRYGRGRMLQRLRDQAEGKDLLFIGKGNGLCAEAGCVTFFHLPDMLEYLERLPDSFKEETRRELKIP